MKDRAKFQSMIARALAGKAAALVALRLVTTSQENHGSAQDNDQTW